MTNRDPISQLLEHASGDESAADLRRVAALMALGLRATDGTMECEAGSVALIAEGRGAHRLGVLAHEECRRAVASVSRLINAAPVAAAARPPRRAWLLAGSGLAAAAVLTLMVANWADQGAMRDGVITALPAPVALPATRAGELVWTSTTASIHEVVVYDRTGQVIHQVTTSDTALMLPDSILQRAAGGFWRVRAQVEAGRWAESDLASVGELDR